MNIYVGNLAQDVTEDDLRRAFAAFGEVGSINIVKDRASGESRGFGFVEMSSKHEALTAIKETDGTDLKGRSIKVNEAHDRRRGRDQRGNGFRRGGSGGNRRRY